MGKQMMGVRAAVKKLSVKKKPTSVINEMGTSKQFSKQLAPNSLLASKAGAKLAGVQV